MSLRRTELKRKTPLRGGGELKRTRLKPISDRKRAQMPAAAAFRKAVLERDNHACVVCFHLDSVGSIDFDRPPEGLEYQLRKLEVHHLDGRSHPDTVNDPDNGVTLCTWHHHYGKIAPHNSRPMWERFWKAISEVKQGGNCGG